MTGDVRRATCESAIITRRVALGLGGNRGAVAQAMENGLRFLEEAFSVRVVQRSGLYCTSAVGRASKPFLNAAAVVETELDLPSLMKRCQMAERDAGREASARWDDRPLDIDLLLSEREVISTESLVVPHRQLHIRRFAIDPLAEICGEWIHPLFDRTISSLALHWQRRPLRVALFVDGVSISDQWNDRIEKVSGDADLILTTRGAQPRAWPPVIDLREFPLPVEEAVEAALVAVLDEPEK